MLGLVGQSQTRLGRRKPLGRAIFWSAVVPVGLAAAFAGVLRATGIDFHSSDVWWLAVFSGAAALPWGYLAARQLSADVAYFVEWMVLFGLALVAVLWALP